MGLDSVELVLNFEEVFQISISDQEAERMRTPRDVIDCIASRLSVTTSGPAVVIPAREEAAWMQLGSALQSLRIVHQAASRDQKLEDLFADRGMRRQRWRELKQQLHVKAWPGLRWLGRFGDFPSPLKTLGDLSDWMIRNNLQPLSEQELQMLTREDIALLVRNIVLYQIGLSEEKYGENQRFIEDMGVD